MIEAGYRSERRIFPWISREEFKSIYNELFSNDQDLQQHALNRICVWQSRAVHKLSVAIDSTYTIISADLAYQKSIHNLDDTEIDLRLRKDYSLALIRFVNHVTEKNQTKHYAQPIHILAAEIGVPEWIVELRHNATHGALPSLIVLRAGARWALSWLKNKYWEKQVASMDLAKIEAAAKEAESACSSKLMHLADNRREIVKSVLLSYQQHRFQELSNPAVKDPEAKVAMDNLNRALLEYRSDFVQTLLKEGHLVSTHQQLQPLGHCINDSLDPSDLLQPDSLVKFWTQLLRILHHNKMIPLLLRSALLSLPSTLAADVDTFHATQILRWVYTILYHIQLTEAGKGVRFRGVYSTVRIFKSSCSLPYKSLLQLVLKNPFSKGCTTLIDLLINKQTRQAFSDEKRRKYKRLAAIYFNKETETDEVVVDSNEEHGGIYTAEDITKGIDREGGSNTSASHIQPCTDSLDWSKVPIGFLPNFSSLYPRLDLEEIHREELEEMSGIEDSMCSDGDSHTSPLISSDPCEWNFNSVLKNVKIL